MCNPGFQTTKIGLNVLVICFVNISQTMRLSFLLFFLLGVSPTYAEQTQFDPEKLGGSEYCGLCHTQIYQEWNASTHHFSSFNNPIYRKTVIGEIGIDGSSTMAFCAACHDPLLKVSAIGANTAVDTDSWEANAGITCLACHRMKDIGEKNGDYIIEEPLLNPFALAEQPKLQYLHETLLNLVPNLHRSAMTRKIYSQSEYCAVCHTLEVPSRINGHANLPLFDEYKSWRASRYANESASKKTCQACHMPLVPSSDPAAKNGFALSHSFAASNTVLPRLNRDLTHLDKVETFLTQGFIELDVLGVRESDADEFVAPDLFSLTDSDHLQIKVKVHNVGVGHHFPGGTADSSEAWLSVNARDNRGATIASQGEIDADDELPEDAVKFGATFIDANGKVTNRATTTTNATALLENHLIAPGEERVAIMGLRPNAPISAPIEVTVRLNWRKYDPNFIAELFSGEDIPKQRISIISETKFTLNINER